jgi:hypothetical protein
VSAMGIFFLCGVGVEVPRLPNSGVEALGGSLELVAQFGDKRIAIAGIEAQPPTRPVNKPLKRTAARRRNGEVSLSSLPDSSWFPDAAAA